MPYEARPARCVFTRQHVPRAELKASPYVELNEGKVGKRRRGVQGARLPRCFACKQRGLRCFMSPMRRACATGERPSDVHVPAGVRPAGAEWRRKEAG